MLSRSTRVAQSSGWPAAGSIRKGIWPSRKGAGGRWGSLPSVNWNGCPGPRSGAMFGTLKGQKSWCP
eukprot:3987208-Alexandrium_andersonii.AAC.1